MRKFFQTISHIGIKPETPFGLRNKLRVFNIAVLVTAFISIFYLVIGVLYVFNFSVIATAFSVISCLLMLFWVKRGRYLLTFHFGMWYGFIFLSAFSFLFGKTNNSYYYFLFLPVACSIIFDCRKTILIYFFISMIFLLGNIYYVENFDPYYRLGPLMHYFAYPNVTFAGILIFMVVSLFKRENADYAEKIEEQNKALEEKNHEITDSINYAKKIQTALIPAEDEFKTFFSDSFVWLKPKDIVSGDFYWISEKNGKIFYATADCTGHGVPGGFMTMLGISFLEEIVSDKKIAEPAEILNQMRDRIIQALKQTAAAGESKDGMDITLCVFDPATKKLKYAAANNSLFILRSGIFTEYKPDKQPVGFHHEIKSFTQQEIQLQSGDHIYTFTDGFPDQFGGPKGKKFKYKQLQELLVANSASPMSEQKEKLQQKFEAWRGHLEQVDDVLLIGIRI
jgi:sigma-B regulation protein RsbU (phosphoserine phosphatase)